MTSMPQMSRPMMRLMRSKVATFVGWTRSVTSTAATVRSSGFHAMGKWMGVLRQLTA